MTAATIIPLATALEGCEALPFFDDLRRAMHVHPSVTSMPMLDDCDPELVAPTAWLAIAAGVTLVVRRTSPSWDALVATVRRLVHAASVVGVPVHTRRFEDCTVVRFELEVAA